MNVNVFCLYVMCDVVEFAHFGEMLIDRERHLYILGANILSVGPYFDRIIQTILQINVVRHDERVYSFGNLCTT